MSNHVPRRSRKKLAEIDPSKVGKLLRLLASDKPGEVVAAAAALKRRIFMTWPPPWKADCAKNRQHLESGTTAAIR